MSKKDERQKSKAAAKSAVATVLAEDEAMQKLKMEEVFAEYESQLNELRDAEVAAMTKNQELSTQVESLLAEKEALESEIASLKEELAKATTKVEEVSKQNTELAQRLTDLEKEAAMQKRMTELEEAGLLTSDKITDKLNSRIRKMDDEEFADYKVELTAFKADWSKVVEVADDKSTEDAAGKSSECKDKCKDKDDPKECMDDCMDDSDDEDKEGKGSKGEKAKAKPANPAMAEQTEEADVADPESAKITMAKLLQLKKELASLNQQTTIGSLKDDEGLVKEFASMWQEEDK